MRIRQKPGSVIKTKIIWISLGDAEKAFSSRPPPGHLPKAEHEKAAGPPREFSLSPCAAQLQQKPACEQKGKVESRGAPVLSLGAMPHQPNPHTSDSDLQRHAREIRAWCVKMITKAASGHPGGSLSLADIMSVFYFKVLKHDPKNPEWKERDRFILSKGHGVPAQYAAMAMTGYFPE